MNEHFLNVPCEYATQAIDSLMIICPVISWLFSSEIQLAALQCPVISLKSLLKH